MLISYKLVAIQGIKNTSLSEVTDAYVSDTAPAGLRGSILASNGDELAFSEMRPTIFADPGEITGAAPLDRRSVAAQRAYEASRLAPLLHKSVRTLEADFAEATTYVVLAADQSETLGNRIHDMGLPGVNDEPEPVRFHPDGDLASPLLGAVDSGGGYSGLEYEFNHVLSGIPGRLIESVDQYGQPVAGSITEDKPAVNGDDVLTTINEALQYQTEQALSKAIVASRSQSGGTAIVMDTRTGDLLAVASMVPSSKGPVEAPSAQAFTNVYEPGSVAKVVTVSAALAEHTITPTSLISIPASGVGTGTPGLSIGGTVFHDAEDHPAEDLTPTGVLAQSSNLGAIRIGEGLGAQRLYRYIQAYGLTQRTGVHFPAESSGLVPTPAQFSDTTLPTLAFGEADAVTAAQMIAAFNTVADGGVYVTPRLVTATVGADGREQATPVQAPRRVIPEAIATEVTGMLQQVVSSGTGTLAKITSYAVAGKTGTALSRNPGPAGGYLSDIYTSSFAGFAPAQKPAVTVMVVINQTPEFGAEASAPAFATITRDALFDLGIPSAGAQAKPSISSLPIVDGQPETSLLGL